MQVSQIEDDTVITPDPENDIYFNGINTCFVTFPKSVAAAPAQTLPPTHIFPGIQDTDSDDEDDDVGDINTNPPVWSLCKSNSLIDFVYLHI